ncbi:MAG: hypothetical protein ACR2IU_01690 [Candidatus Nanopelagicaceae bacterium]
MRISFKSLRAENLNSIGLSGVGLSLGVGLAVGVGLSLGAVDLSGVAEGEIDEDGLASFEEVLGSEDDEIDPRKINPRIIKAFCQNFKALNFSQIFLNIL